MFEQHRKRAACSPANTKGTGARTILAVEMVDFLGGSNEETVKQAAALLSTLEVSLLRDNLKNSLEILQRNEVLLAEINKLAAGSAKEGDDQQERTATRTRHVLEMNANLFELSRLYSALASDLS